MVLRRGDREAHHFPPPLTNLCRHPFGDAGIGGISADQKGRDVSGYAHLSATKDKSTIILEASRHDINLTPEDITGVPGGFLIDGMPWDQWLDAMTMD